MTENEAIKEVKRWISILMSAGSQCVLETAESQEMAIQALEEIQSYRAIGTVEDIQSMKDNGAFSGIELAQIAAMQMKLKEYQSIGTVEELQALKSFKNAYDQVRWERDIAISQLEEIAETLKGVQR